MLIELNLPSAVYTTAALLVLGALSANRIIFLRVLYLAASVTYTIYGIMLNLHEIIFWNSINIILNSFRIYLYFLETIPWFIYGTDLLVYKSFFSKFMLPGQFRAMMKLAVIREYKDEVILEENIYNQNIYFTIKIDGQLVIEKANRFVITLHDNSFFGEMSFIKRQKTTATVRVMGLVKCYYWSSNNLHELKKKHPETFNILTLILSHDLVTKLSNQSIP